MLVLFSANPGGELGSNHSLPRLGIVARYLKVLWHHGFDDTPVVLYSELDEARFELRKIEVYRDGRHDYADRTRATGATWLSVTPIPPDEEIAAQPEFSPAAIAAEEFEQVWRRATR